MGVHVPTGWPEYANWSTMAYSDIVEKARWEPVAGFSSERSVLCWGYMLHLTEKGSGYQSFLKYLHLFLTSLCA